MAPGLQCVGQDRIGTLGRKDWEIGAEGFMTTISLRNTFQYIRSGRQEEQLDERVFGKKLGLLTRLIGCSHERISRPFGEGKSTYRSCLSCGARKPFDTETLETSKTFYCPPAVQA